MPTTYNGIGTWYYGKKNGVSYQNYCPNCHRYVTLSSYDTREWFVILFVPVIPLQRRRVMDDCPACRKHKQLPLKKYLKLKDDDYAAAMDKYDANPNDPEVVAELLGVFAGYQDMESFEALTREAAEQFVNNANVQTTIGSIYYKYGNMEQARQYLEKALSIEDDERAHELLGFVYLRLSNPDQAAGHFQHIIDQQIQSKAGTLLSLVDGYQGQGRHQEALALLDTIAAIDPAMEKQKPFKKSRKLSEKHQHSSTPIKNKQFVHGSPQHSAPTPKSRKKAWGIAAAILTCIFLFYMAGSVIMGKKAAVYLVNGLNRSYEVTLDGQTYVIPETGYKKIRLAEGLRKLSVADPELSIEPQTLKLHSPFWRRLFLDRVYVINPDAVALVEWTKVYYAEQVHQAPDPEWNLYAGQVLYVFDEVDFPFKPFPDEISLSGSSPESRIQVSIVEDNEVPREQFPAVVEHYLGFEAQLNYLKKYMYYEPDNRTYLFAFLGLADPDTFIEAIRPGLDTVPPRIEWHRMYQNTLRISKPEYDLKSEYQQRLDQMPDSSEYQYLYGRILDDDRQQAIEWFTKSIEGSSPCGYGYYALGFDAMMIADFKAALSWYEQALKTEPDNPFFCDYYCEMLIADNQPQKACDFCSERMLKDANDYTWMQERAALLYGLSRGDQADQLFEQWCRQNKDVYSEEDFQILQRGIQLNRVYQDGDVDAIRQFVGEPNMLDEQVMFALHSGQPISDELMARSDAFPPMWKLLFYISEHRLGNEDNANLFLSEAVKQLKAGTYDQRYAAGCLCDEQPIDEQKVCCLGMDVPLKAVTLVAMGIKYPEHREAFFDLAKQLNYKKTFPYHYLKSIYNES